MLVKEQDIRKETNSAGGPNGRYADGKHGANGICDWHSYYLLLISLNLA